MNPRSTDCKAGTLTTTPSHRFAIAFLDILFIFKDILDVLIRYINTMIDNRAKNGTFELVLDSRGLDIHPKKILKAISARAIHLSSDDKSGQKV